MEEIYSKEYINKIKNSGDFVIQEYDFSPQVKLNISTTIDKDYINDIVLRLSYYRRLADIKNDKEAKAIILELQNRFGEVPEEIYNILEITKIKALCKKCGIIKLEYKDDFINISFFDNKFKNPDYLIKLMQEGKAFMKKQNVLSFSVHKIKLFDDIEEILEKLSVV